MGLDGVILKIHVYSGPSAKKLSPDDTRRVQSLMEGVLKVDLERERVPGRRERRCHCGTDALAAIMAPEMMRVHSGGRTDLTRFRRLPTYRIENNYLSLLYLSNICV